MVSLGSGGYIVKGMEVYFRVNLMFVSGNVRKVIENGDGDFIFVFFYEVLKLFREKRLKCDVVLV